MIVLLRNIAAVPHPDGNGINLHWENPQADVYPGIKIVRREGTYPVSMGDGFLAAEKNAFFFKTTLSLYGDLDNKRIPPNLFLVFANEGIHLSAKAEVLVVEPSAKWLIEDNIQKYILKISGGTISVWRATDSAFDGNLKSETVYYYSLFAFKTTAGSQIEYAPDAPGRAAAMATGPYNFAGQMYELLPRIYHRYDTALSQHVSKADRQKGELRRLLDIPGSQLDQLYSYARALLDIHNIDKVDGRLIPLLAEWIGWNTDYRSEIDLQRNETRAAPFIYETTGLIPNVEAAIKRINGWECKIKEFVHNVFLSNNPEKLNIWEKERDEAGKWLDPKAPQEPLLSLDYAYEGRPAVTLGDGTTWLFYHTCKDRFDKTSQTLHRISNIWYKTRDENGWTPSVPLIDRPGIDKYPAAIQHGDDLLVFWSAYDEDAREWSIDYRVRVDSMWMQDNKYSNPFGTDDAERKKPQLIRDDSDAGHLWLFYMERDSQQRWQMKFTRHDGNWGSPQTIDLLQDEYFEDAFVFYHSNLKRIYLLFSKTDAGGKGSSISCLAKNSLDPKTTDWVKVKMLARTGASYDDREPAAIVNGNGDIDLYWASNRGGPWSIWHSVLTPNDMANPLSIEPITEGPYSQHDPMPVKINGKDTVVFRSNQSISYNSAVYKATRTTDFRYAGSSSLDTRNVTKNELKWQFEDFQAYTYDAGLNDDNWYARNKVGIYLQPGTGDLSLINRNQYIIKQLLDEILPIQVKAVFSIETASTERYKLPTRSDSFFDRLDSLVSEPYSGVQDEIKDIMPGWVGLYSSICKTRQYVERHSVNFSVPRGTPVDTKYRTWHSGLTGLKEK